MILPYYFPYPAWYISPEQHWGKNHHPDYTMERVNPDGSSLPYAFLELKRAKMYEGVPNWEKMLDQMWSQCDGANSEIDGNGRMWTIAQRGLVICFFKFYLLRFQDDTIYTNFEPLNISSHNIAWFNTHNIEIDV